MMRRIAAVVLACLSLGAGTGYAAEPGTSASAVAELMRKARLSNGFEARLNVFVTKTNGAHLAPLKLAVIGQVSADRQRLLIRGISPEPVHNRFYAVERGSDGRLRGIESRADGEQVGFDPYVRMFDSGLVAWDMLSPWWGWPKQLLEGSEQIDGRDCQRLRSVTDDEKSTIREVESCVDQQAGLSLRTRLFDSRHVLIRTTSVEKIMRKGEGGAMAAKKLAIRDAGKMLTHIEVYAGDEQYEITADTFAALDKLTRNEQQKTK